MTNDTSEELRIIARDRRLATVDREAIKRGAEELDQAYRALVLTQQELILSQQKRMALTEVIMGGNIPPKPLNAYFTPMYWHSLVKK